MSSVNKVILIGNLGANPELRQTSGGVPVTELRLATNESWVDKDSQRQTRTEWHRIVVWGRQAETVARYLTKGRSVYVEGRLQTREWTDKDGQRRFTTEVVASNVVFLGGGQGGGQGGPPPADDGDFGGGGGGPSGGGYGGGPSGGFGGGGSGNFDDGDIPF